METLKTAANEALTALRDTTETDKIALETAFKTAVDARQAEVKKLEDVAIVAGSTEAQKTEAATAKKGFDAFNTTLKEAESALFVAKIEVEKKAEAETKTETNNLTNTIGTESITALKTVHDIKYPDRKTMRTTMSDFPGYINHLQTICILLGASTGLSDNSADRLGPITRAGIKTIQQYLNTTYPDSKLGLDGLPGPLMLAQLFSPVSATDSMTRLDKMLTEKAAGTLVLSLQTPEATKTNGAGVKKPNGGNKDDITVTNAVLVAAEAAKVAATKAKKEAEDKEKADKAKEADKTKLTAEAEKIKQSLISHFKLETQYVDKTTKNIIMYKNKQGKSYVFGKDGTCYLLGDYMIQQTGQDKTTKNISGRDSKIDTITKILDNIGNNAAAIARLIEMSTSTIGTEDELLGQILPLITKNKSFRAISTSYSTMGLDIQKKNNLLGMLLDECPRDPYFTTFFEGILKTDSEYVKDLLLNKTRILDSKILNNPKFIERKKNNNIERNKDGKRAVISNKKIIPTPDTTIVSKPTDTPPNTTNKTNIADE